MKTKIIVLFTLALSSIHLGTDLTLTRSLGSEPTRATVVWFDLSVQNLENAMGFYGPLFGWKFNINDFNGFKFAVISADGVESGTLMPLPGNGAIKGGNKAGGTSIYFQVDDISEAYLKALKLGAESVFPPMDIPDNKGKAALIKDFDGNLIGLYSKKIAR